MVDILINFSATMKQGSKKCMSSMSGVIGTKNQDKQMKLLPELRQVILEDSSSGGACFLVVYTNSLLQNI